MDTAQPKGWVCERCSDLRSVFVETREHGLWVSDRSLRLYMDVTSVMASDIMGRLKPWASLAASIEDSFDRFFQFW